jgi:hypothetical protein
MSSFRAGQCNPIRRHSGAEFILGVRRIPAARPSTAWLAISGRARALFSPRPPSEALPLHIPLHAPFTPSPCSAPPCKKLPRSTL